MDTLEAKQGMWTVVLGCAAAGWLAGCGGGDGDGGGHASARAQQLGGEAPGRRIPGVTVHCNQWDTLIVGPYKYENNMWGIDKAKGFEPDQCLLERTSGGSRQLGWTWHWAGHDPSVFAFPEIIYGWKPWAGGRPSDRRFPMRVAEIRRLTLDYAVEIEATGSYNLAPEIWMTRSGQWSERPNPLLITSEIMFWMDYRGGAVPAGRVIDRPVIGGVTYELWKSDSMGDKGDGTGWKLFTFKSPTIQHSGRLDLRRLLDYMVDRGHVGPDEHVASLEFGNELVGGSGTTWVKRYVVDAE